MMRRLSDILKTVVKSRIILILLILAPLLAFGEPTKTPKYLMAESMSLMDWGIYKANMKLASFDKFNNALPLEYLLGSARYDWDENRIILAVQFWQGNDTKDDCTKTMKAFKAVFTDFTYGEEEQEVAAERILGQLFSHAGGYQSGSRPGDVGKQLVHITRIEARILVRETMTYDPALCKSTFKSEEVSVISK